MLIWFLKKQISFIAGKPVLKKRSSHFCTILARSCIYNVRTEIPTVWYWFLRNVSGSTVWSRLRRTKLFGFFFFFCCCCCCCCFDVVVVCFFFCLFVLFFVCLFVCLFVFRKWPAFKHNLKLMVRLDICFMYFPPRECFTQVTVIFQDFLYFTFIVPFYHVPSVPWKKRLCISTSKVMPLAVW